MIKQTKEINLVKLLFVVFGFLFTFLFLTIFFLANTKVSADTTTSANASVTVSDACTLSGGDHSYNVTLNPGQENSNIGPSNIKAACNDYNGYSIYAIGYSGNSYTGNNTKLLGTIANNNISTNTSGNDSYWAMKVNAVSGTYTPTITNDFDNSNFHVIPASYTQIAKLTSATDAGSNPTGSNISTYYKVKISISQTADTYTGKVKYTLVHPNTAPEPWTPQPVVTNPGYISYNTNAPFNEVTDTMSDQTLQTTDTEALLWASNFQRSGYGFAGWSDKPDWVLNQNDANGNGTGANEGYHIYGPNQTITFTAGQYTGDNPGLSLYAVWVPSQGNLQSWSGCSSMSQGQVTALTDQRDNDTYAVAKLKDNNCWMIENLRLDNTAAHNSDGTLAQGYNPSFVGLADPETTNFSDSTIANSLYSIDGSTAAPAITGNSQGTRFPRYNNQNTANPVADMTVWTPPIRYDSGQNTYSVGNYYTWAAVIADTSYYGSGDHGTTSICPHGWRLPIGDQSIVSKSFGGLSVALGGPADGGNISDDFDDWEDWSEYERAGKEFSNLFRKYPNDFILSGDFYNSPYSTAPNNRSYKGVYWSSTVDSSSSAFNFRLDKTNAFPGNSLTNKYNGFSVRCLANT